MRNNKLCGRRFTEDEKEFLNSYIAGHHHSEIIEEYNKRFDVPLTSQRLKNYINRNGLNTGMSGRYTKGHEPHNKGKKPIDYMSAEGYANSCKTRFKKGNTPPQHKAVGTEVITRDGFVVVKVAEPNKWKYRSHIVYSEHHGNIPQGSVVRHINGISSDDRIENLMLIDMGTNGIINKLGLFTDDAEINKSVIALAKLKRKIGKVKKGCD